MRIKILMLIILITLSGCFYQKIDRYEIDKALQFCKDKGGIFTIEETFVGGTYITCINGDKKADSEIKLEQIKE